MSQKLNSAGIDIGKNSFHVVGHDRRGAIVLRQKWSRGKTLTHFEPAGACPFSDGITQYSRREDNFSG